MQRKGSIVQALIPALIIPIVLIVMVVVFANIETPGLSSTTITMTSNKTFALNNTWYDYTANEPVVDGVTRLVNSSGDAQTLNTTYEVNYGDGTIRTRDGQNGSWYLTTFSYYPADAYAGITDTADATYDAFSLATILPIVVISVAILGILIGAFVVF